MLNNYSEFVGYSLNEMKTDGEKRQMVKTVKLAIGLFYSYFVPKNKIIKRGYLSGWLKGRHTLPVANHTWEYYQEEAVA